MPGDGHHLVFSTDVIMDHALFQIQINNFLCSLDKFQIYGREQWFGNALPRLVTVFIWPIAFTATFSILRICTIHTECSRLGVLSALF